MSLTHFDAQGQAHMVDVSDKAVTDRVAVAAGHIKMARETFEIIAEGKRISAQDCLHFGMCNEIVPVQELEAAVLQRAKKLAQGAPLSQAAVKKVLQQMESMNLSQAIDLEAEIQQTVVETEDCRNAIAAFFRKEKPVFNGR